MAQQYSLDDLIYLMQRLRDPQDGCPWDKVQTLKTIAPHTLEEVYEVIDTIETGDYQHLKEELGDLLFQVVFYAQISDEEQQFNLKGIIHDLVAKLIRRHPHVFPTGELTSRVSEQNIELEQVAPNWDKIKEGEKQQPKYLLDTVPDAFPAMLKAFKMQKKVAKVGFEWPEEQGVYDKIAEELEEFKQASLTESNDRQEEEFGDLLFSLINLARWRGINPESALRRTNQKFAQRFNYIDEQLGGNFNESSLDEMEALWNAAKKREK